MDDLRDKIARLPVWARELVRHLEKAAEPNNDELRYLRQKVTAAEEKVKRMQARDSIMHDLFICAGKGGHEVAQAYVDRVIAEYTVCEVCGGYTSKLQPGGCTCE